MPTDQNMQAIVSGRIQSFSFFHNYTEILGMDRVLIHLEDNKLIYVKIDPDSHAILERKSILYKNKLVQALLPFRGLLANAKLVPLKITGVHFDSYDVIFVIFENTESNEQFLTQINTDDDFESAEVIVVDPFPEHKEFVNVSVNQNIAFTDYKRTTNIDIYIVYIDYVEKKAPEIRGMRVVVTEDEKDELKDCIDLDFPYTKYPVIDKWSEKDILFSKLPQDTTDVKIDFSTGLSFLKFS